MSNKIDMKAAVLQQINEKAEAAMNAALAGDLVRATDLGDEAAKLTMQWTEPTYMTVSALIEGLSKFDGDARVYTIEPPFHGVRIIRQGDGAVLVCAPPKSAKG